jgi:lysophospholipase L1-like esterase
VAERTEAGPGLRIAAALLLFGAALLALGWLAGSLGEAVLCDPEIWTERRDLRRCTLYVYPTAHDGGIQLGTLALALGAGLLALTRVASSRRVAILAGVRKWSLRIAAIALLSFITGEVAVRLAFPDGMSFGGHFVPLVRRFERNFVLNHHDGPARGPAVEGPKQPGVTRILVQGDSISWGQGVKHERDIYTERLLASLRRANPKLEIAALVKGGREINGHLEQIRSHGAEIAPDVIVYQWFINDIELDKSGRPIPRPPWQRLFFHPTLAAGSAFWFFLDTSLSGLWPTERTYPEYIATDHAAGTQNWRDFEAEFGRWADEAQRLTPRVLIALYPSISPPADTLYDDVRERVVALAHARGIETLQWSEALDKHRGEYRALWASPYDAHPSALAHETMAMALEARLRELWPDVIR